MIKAFHGNWQIDIITYVTQSGKRIRIQHDRESLPNVRQGSPRSLAQRRHLGFSRGETSVHSGCRYFVTMSLIVLANFTAPNSFDTLQRAKYMPLETATPEFCEGLHQHPHFRW